MSKTVGVLGGMGPLATVDLFRKIVENTPADIDQEHLRITIENNPLIPPRVEAILQGAESPLPMMSESARVLERAGADFIIIPCNTAHYWLEELRQAVNIPIYSMIDNAADCVAARREELAGGVLLLATEATIRLNLYQDACAARGLDIVVPSTEEQAVFAAAIREIKAGRLADNSRLREINTILAHYAADGIAAILAGCTEIPILMPYFETAMEKFDATLLLAQLAIAQAKGEAIM